MRKINFIIVLFLIFINLKLHAQCEIKNRVLADGTMTYYFDPADFYVTKTKSLKINIVTDKEHFYIALQPSPFPVKKDGKKIKEDLVIHLSDQNIYKLEHYDTQYMHNDSIMQVLYLIDQKDVKAFSKFEAVVAEINIEETGIVRNYDFKLHKDAIVKQLACFFKKEDK